MKTGKIFNTNNHMKTNKVSKRNSNKDFGKILLDQEDYAGHRQKSQELSVLKSFNSDDEKIKSIEVDLDEILKLETGQIQRLEKVSQAHGGIDTIDQIIAIYKNPTQWGG